MFRHIRFIALVLLLSGSFSFQVRAEEILAWRDCLWEAKENHPDLISAQEKLNQAKADKAVTASGALPQLSSDLSQRTSKAATKDETDTYSYGVSGQQLLFDGMKTPYKIRSATEDINSAQHSYDSTSADVRYRLRSAFVQLLRAQELLGITEDIAQRRKQNLELVQLRYEAGREHKGSLLTAQANLAQAEFEVKETRWNIRLAQRQLIKELGRKEFSPLAVKGSFKIKYTAEQTPDFEKLVSINPDLLELIAKREAARFDLKSTKADFFPEVSASASSGRTASYWPPDQNVWSAGVSLSFPIFEGGSRIAQVSSSRAAFNQAQADERSGRDAVILALEEAWLNLLDTVGKVEIEEKFLQAAQERAKITQAQYSTGLISFDNWIIIEDALVSAKKSFVQAQVNALTAQAGWIQAKGGTLDEE